MRLIHSKYYVLVTKRKLVLRVLTQEVIIGRECCDIYKRKVMEFS